MTEKKVASSVPEGDVSHCFLPIFLLFGLGASDRAAAGARGGRRTPFVRGASAPYGGPIRARAMPPQAVGTSPFIGRRPMNGYPYRRPY
ncbi:MAG: hypothetical protein OWT28_02670 [Firmicutes bacterium]|nr:hypothetical protein [Bacillota bacterium]